MKSRTVNRVAGQRPSPFPSQPSETPIIDTIRASRITARVAVSDALAREIGALAFTSADRWGARA